MTKFFIQLLLSALVGIGAAVDVDLDDVSLELQNQIESALDLEIEK